MSAPKLCIDCGEPSLSAADGVLHCTNCGWCDESLDCEKCGKPLDSHVGLGLPCPVTSAQPAADTITKPQGSLSSNQRTVLQELVNTAAEVYRISERATLPWHALAAALKDARAVLAQPDETGTDHASLAKRWTALADLYEREGIAPGVIELARESALALHPKTGTAHSDGEPV